jgi:HSP20 family protein
MTAEKTVPQTLEQQNTAVQERSREDVRYIAPPVDIYELSDKLMVLADVPGATHESIRVNLEDNILTIQASTHKDRQVQPLYREFQLMNYYRQFQISEQIDTENIGAELKHGVLHIELPKVEKAKPRQIEVKSAQ